ncbi:hypothetical protein [Mycobacterium malmoense]|uniref:hypothetical protein n=1 Tax=Mycobacterium malmoense TaxID=1780 RepID=UPI0011461DA8|nr:hypothetical protein [Mycobacterium malmoense]
MGRDACPETLAARVDARVTRVIVGGANPGVAGASGTDVVAAGASPPNALNRARSSLNTGEILARAAEVG